MTVPPVSKLSTLNWIRLPDTRLKALGFDPDHRIHYTGHRHNLLPAWIPSIGNWGMLNTREFVNEKDPSRVVLRGMKVNTYHQFKYRYGLKTRDELEAQHRPELPPWFLGDLAWRQHQREQRAVLEANGDVGYSIGMACQAIYQRGRDEFSPFGILPIELVVWTRLFHRFLGTIRSYAEWKAIDEVDRYEIWNTGIEGRGWSVALELEAHAVARLPERPKLAATG